MKKTLPKIKKEVKRVNITLTSKETGKTTSINCIGFAYKKLIDGIYQWVVKTIHGIFQRLEEELTFFKGIHTNYKLNTIW